MQLNFNNIPVMPNVIWNNGQKTIVLIKHNNYVCSY